MSAFLIVYCWRIAMAAVLHTLPGKEVIADDLGTRTETC